MIYPEFIEKGKYIGVTAPSAGIVQEDKIIRLNNAKKNIEKLGYKYIETDNVRTNNKGRSASAEERAKQFMSLWENSEVTAIISATGGDFLYEMLEYLDWNKLKNSKSKWFQGYSDNTCLGFTLTTMLDIATIYGDNAVSYGMEPLFETLQNAIKIMEGEKIIQESFEKYQIEKSEDPLATYNLTEENKWETIDNKQNIEFKGRCLGGCFDVIVNLFGSKYDKVKEYLEKYKSDGIVWFLEIFEMSTAQLYLNLLKMKQQGYFKYCNGIIFGRSLMLRVDYEISFKETIQQVLQDLNIPIIYNADIGHVSPQMPIVNGAVLNISLKEKGRIETILS